MTISWLKTNSSQDLFLKDRHSIYNIEILSPNHIGIINMWVKDCIIVFKVLTLTKFLILKRRAFALFSCITISETWCFQFKFLSTLMPRYLTESVRKSCLLFSLTLTSLSNFFLWCLKITNSVFCKFREILFAIKQSVKFFISRFPYLLSLVIDSLKWRRFVSSAKWWTLQNFIAWFKSLICIKNKKGPRTELWGTTYKTRARFESWQFIETNCSLSYK